MSDVGDALRALKASSRLTWDQLASSLGASSGDYVRKVASGAKPGRNLAPNVAELTARGKVSAPVRRRHNAAGQTARVRGKTGSVVPVQQKPAKALRGSYSTTTQLTGQGKIVTVTAPKSDGVGRERGRLAIMDAARQAKKNGSRIRFVIRNDAGASIPLGGHGGYNPADFLARAKAEGNDPYAVLAADMEGSKYDDTNAPIIEVDVEEF
jgi:hypothetical protein